MLESLDITDKSIKSNMENSMIIEDEIKNIIDKNPGQNIKSDIELLKTMGFDKKMINKVYILLRPENIERAIDYMTEINGIYQHDFIQSNNPNEKSLCFICKNIINKHLNYIPNDLLNDVQMNNNNKIIQEKKDNIIKETDKGDNIPLNKECDVCYESISKEEEDLNEIPCGHLFCNHCWFNYLKSLITEAKVEKIKCMDHECNDIIPEKFILQHLSENNDLIEKYYKFKKRAEILQDKNKKLCPQPNCESFLQNSKSQYVKCENGHEFCFNCLRPPHGKESCDKNLENQLIKWTKGKRVKRCPRCKIYTEKNEGCNHMTCVNCKYQWCWLCEGEYQYGHYDSGKCQGQQFTKADAPQKIKQRRNIDFNVSYGCGFYELRGCLYPIYNNDFDNLCCKYIAILCFWLFGIPVVFFNIISQGMRRMQRNCAPLFFMMALFMILSLFICFQILFTILSTPFILICLIYHRCFGCFLIIFRFRQYNFHNGIRRRVSFDDDILDDRSYDLEDDDYNDDYISSLDYTLI